MMKDTVHTYIHNATDSALKQNGKKKNTSSITVSLECRQITKKNLKTSKYTYKWTQTV